MHIDDSLYTPSIAAVCLLFICLIPFAGAGVALISTGLNRSHSAAHSFLTCIVPSAVAVLAYFVIGFAWQGTAGAAGHSFTIAGKSWDWLGAARPFLAGVGLDGRPASLMVLFSFFGVALTSIIAATSLGERWRIGASCVSTTLLAAWTYPLFAHWVWGGGWLAELGAQYGLGAGFLDSAGTGSIHCVGGLTALALAWIRSEERRGGKEC